MIVIAIDDYVLPLTFAGSRLGLLCFRGFTTRNHESRCCMNLCDQLIQFSTYRRCRRSLLWWVVYVRVQKSETRQRSQHGRDTPCSMHGRKHGMSCILTTVKHRQNKLTMA